MSLLAWLGAAETRARARRPRALALQTQLSQTKASTTPIAKDIPPGTLFPRTRHMLARQRQLSWRLGVIQLIAPRSAEEGAGASWKVPAYPGE